MKAKAVNIQTWQTSPTDPAAIWHGDCTRLLLNIPTGSVDFVLTDPPYGVRYRSRDGETVHNDDNLEWLWPAFSQIHRVMKPGALCFCFYGWHAADQFIHTWRDAGLHIVGHAVFAKRYAASRHFFEHRHEQGYLLEKGRATRPARPIPDIIPWTYTANRLHPTQKPVKPLQSLIETFCKPGGLVLDPFCGSGSTLLAAKLSGRPYLGIELDERHHATATRRLAAA